MEKIDHTLLYDLCNIYSFYDSINKIKDNDNDNNNNKDNSNDNKDNDNYNNNLNKISSTISNQFLDYF